ncbi:MotA/TolQ/ExbB proton channel family protein [Desulfovibrio subterraneus]|jgi:chemotaxis protein MotA|uniref:Chemotaxis protein MotA n=1 Tax=Desulfovibrio subterraneus TaxID=2718620 RepID=A0A7J0BFJ3_9BACT|nr:MotA/TolQ/ExbB proton channel family protein [Desulfovibrio subterraneus]WBF66745.1 MotA/TolQ/ExbB proton channel family protein [Desulfovibrio subterraneus]GFM32459.1 chemotaxis protein MotA [Desulfovibrio subterraneus]
MDLATILGIVISFGLVVSAIMAGSSLLIFIDIPSFLIVFGGTIGALLVNYPLGKVIAVFGVIKKTLFAKAQSPTTIIEQFMDYANRARREGILSLEPIIKEIDDAYLRKGLQLTVDGLEPQAIQEIMETEISNIEGRHESGQDIVKALGEYAPSLGMIGTVIGLVQMLQTMSDPSSIGPAMAVALITTFYGAVLANLVFNPMAGKLKTRSKEEILIKEMQMEGILAISKGENPRIIQEKLSSFQPPKERKSGD